jgi:hypothetical protein
MWPHWKIIRENSFNRPFNVCDVCGHRIVRHRNFLTLIVFAERLGVSSTVFRAD